MTTQIPKRMTFIWAGDRVSYLRYGSLFSFVHHNPEWDVHLLLVSEAADNQWTSPEMEDGQSYVGPDYRERIGDLPITTHTLRIPWGMPAVHIKDVLMWQSIACFGGYVADMDIAWTAPMPTVEAPYAFSRFTGLPLKGYMPVTLMGGLAGGGVAADALLNAYTGYSTEEYQCCGTPCFPEWILDTQPTLPETVVYPYAGKRYGLMVKLAHGIGNGVPSVPGCVGIHWYGAHPLSQKMNNAITEKTIRNIKTPVTKALLKCRNHSNP